MDSYFSNWNYQTLIICNYLIIIYFSFSLRVSSFYLQQLSVLIRSLYLIEDKNGLDLFENSKAIIVTFTVTNHLNEADNSKAEAWESQ